jgi:hypothetical protein
MNRVLDELRRDVLARGDYQEPGVDLDFLDEIGFFEAGEEARDSMMAEFTLGPLRWAIDRFGMDGLRAWLESQHWSPDLRRARPRSMEELEALQCVSTAGTHSVLDISRISPEPAYGAISPLAEDALVRFFGTDRPTRSIVEAWYARRDLTGESPFERDQGIYFTVYKDGQPDEIDIEGASGD